MQYTVILEKQTSSDWGAWVPDLPGCVAVGKTREEVSQSIEEAIEFHLEGMRADGSPIPAPSSTAIVVEVAAA
jgi:predicted RNase H-like HicB family nuclease